MIFNLAASGTGARKQSSMRYGRGRKQKFQEGKAKVNQWQRELREWLVAGSS